MYKSEIALILKIKEKWYQLYLKHKTTCLNITCRAKRRLIELLSKIIDFYVRLRSAKWVRVQIWGSDYADFRTHEVISNQKVRMPDGKGLHWPKTKYKHVKMIDEACISGAA